MAKRWSVYIVECKDGKLYTGISIDVPKRVAAHSKGKGSRFTRSRCPVRLRFQEVRGTNAAAQKRERQIKSFSRKQKLKLISGPIV